MEHIFIKGTDNLLVLFHGTGGNENSLLFLTGELDAHASVLSFSGNTGTGKNRRFFKPLINGKVDKKDLLEKVDYFLEKWDNLKFNKDKKITFIGYSNGANFILGILQKRPDIADRTLLLHPADLDWKFNKKPLKSKILATTGSLDLLTPAADVFKIKKELESVGYNDFNVVLLDGGHEINSIEIKKLKEIFKK